MGERFGVEIDSWDLSANRQYFKTQVWLQQMIIVQCPLQGEMEDCFSISEPHKQYEKGKEMIPETEPPARSVGVQHAPGKRGEIASERMKRLDQSGNDAQLWMC